jgi:hypothetical protein
MIIVVWNTFPGFCVASSILVTSSGVNFQNTLQDAHSECAYTAVEYSFHTWYVPSDAAMPADEANDSNGGRGYWRSG